MAYTSSLDCLGLSSPMCRMRAFACMNSGGPSHLTSVDSETEVLWKLVLSWSLRKGHNPEEGRERKQL